MTDKKNNFWFHIIVIIVVSIWGTTYISTSILLDGGLEDTSSGGLKPIQIYTLRSIIAYIGVLIACHKQILVSSLRDELTFIVLGLTGGTIYYLCENTAVELGNTSNVSLIISTVPIATMLLTAAVHKKKISSLMIVGSLIALTGITCVILADNNKFSIGFDAFRGDLLALAAVGSWAIYSVIIPTMFDRYSSLFVTRKVFFYGMLSAVIILIVSGQDIFPIEIISRPIVASNLLYLGLIASLLCFWVFNIAIQRIGIVVTNNYGYLTPVVTFIFAILILGDEFNWYGIIGISITLLGLCIAQRNDTSLKS